MNAYEEEGTHGVDPEEFLLLKAEDDTHLKVVDMDDNILAYRLPAPKQYPETLEKSSAELPLKLKKILHKRGQTAMVH